MMKHLATINYEFVRRALERLTINKGQIVKLRGIPFVLVDDTDVLGTKENLQLTKTAKMYSRRWLKMNRKQQEDYLEDHPGSKKRVTGKPPNYVKRKRYRLKPKFRKRKIFVPKVHSLKNNRLIMTM